MIWYLMVWEEVLELVQEKRCLIDVVWRGKKNWIGHILRGESLLKEVMIGKKTNGTKTIGYAK